MYHIKKTVLTLLIVMVQFSIFGQVIVQKDGCHTLKQGIYKNKSLDQAFIQQQTHIIPSQTALPTAGNAAFLKIDHKTIALFDQISDDETTKPVGVLTDNSIVIVDTIFYQEIFQDTSSHKKVTYNTWYAIRINGVQYYTDYKIHDLMNYQKELPQFKQKFLLVAQSTGYDTFNHHGYPNNFFVVVLSQENELIYTSKVFNFDYGNEFWDDSFVSTEMATNEFRFTLHGLNSKISGTWTGKELQNINIHK